MQEFTAVEDFYSEETRSQYTKDLSYTARAPDDYGKATSKDKKVLAARARCTALNKLLPQWVAEGKVVMGRAEPPRITGRG
jgi:hypothetical protein